MAAPGCRNGKVCVHCAEFQVNTARKTCDSLSKPVVRWLIFTCTLYWVLFGLPLLLISVNWVYFSFNFDPKCLVWAKLWWVSRKPVWRVIAAATAHTTSMRITLETAFLWKTAPVCTAGGCSLLDSAWKATAKPGSVIISSCLLKSQQRRDAHDDLYSHFPVSVVRVSGAAEMSLVLGSARFMGMDIIGPLIPTCTDLTDTVSTPLWRWEEMITSIFSLFCSSSWMGQPYQHNTDLIHHHTLVWIF